MGEVVMRGNIVMKGYHDDPEADGHGLPARLVPFGRPGRLAPGGLRRAARPREGTSSSREARTSRRSRSSRWFPPNPAVLECAVVAVPHEKWGERPKAFVTLKAGAPATEAEIIAHCRASMANFKCPDAVEFGDLPKTATGKVQKYVLREREWAGRRRRINLTRRAGRPTDWSAAPWPGRPASPRARAGMSRRT